VGHVDLLRSVDPNPLPLRRALLDASQRYRKRQDSSVIFWIGVFGGVGRAWPWLAVGPLIPKDFLKVGLGIRNKEPGIETSACSSEASVTPQAQRTKARTSQNTAADRVPSSHFESGGHGKLQHERAAHNMIVGRERAPEWEGQHAQWNHTFEYATGVECKMHGAIDAVHGAVTKMPQRLLSRAFAIEKWLSEARLMKQDRAPSRLDAHAQSQTGECVRHVARDSHAAKRPEAEA